MPCRSESSLVHLLPYNRKNRIISHYQLKRSVRSDFKEFANWPVIPTEAKIPLALLTVPAPSSRSPIGDRMTRKPRARKEDTKETKGGFCEMCNTEYLDVMVHRRSPHHLAFVRDPNNFRSLDALIHSSGDVSMLFDKTGPINGERRSLRKLCNGDSEHASVKSEPTTNGEVSPRNNGLNESRKPRNCRKKSNIDNGKLLDERHYYKVIGVNTKLRSSGTFAAPQRESPPTCNGESTGLVVKFRKVRRSELSVLSDEAEQFMFPRRASTSSSEDDEDSTTPSPERRRPGRPAAKEESVEEMPLQSERRRSARPTALKEVSSEDESLPDDRCKRRKRGPLKNLQLDLTVPEPKLELQTPVLTPVTEIVMTPTLKDEVKERCLKWEDGRLKATPAIEELKFSFESVPKSEPWYESFQRQDTNQLISKDIQALFELYSTKIPKLPYELGQLPPLKPNCCSLSDLVKKDDKGAGPSRSYGTRGNKKQKIRKRTAAALIALEKHPRKSPREHASTLAILGGLLHRRKHHDDAKSTASEDTCSETNSNVKVEPVLQPEEREHEPESLQLFLSEVFEDAGDYDFADEAMEGEATVVTSSAPDVVDLVNECDKCDIIRNEMQEGVANQQPGPGRRGYKFKKKNRTGWPNKRKAVVRSMDTGKPEPEIDTTVVEKHVPDSINESISEMDDSTIASNEETSVKSDRVIPCNERRRAGMETEGSAEEGGSDAGWGTAALQPVVRVAKIDSAMGRRLRSATSTSIRGRRARRGRAYRFR